VRDNIHDWDSWDFPYSSLEVFVASGNYKATMLLYPLHNTIISICALVVTFQPLESGIFGDLEGQPVLYSEFLKFPNHAISNVWDALSEEAVHAGLEDVQFVLDGEVDEIGINDDAIGWSQSVIMREEQAGRLLRSELSERVQLSDFDIVGCLLGQDLSSLAIVLLLFRLVLLAESGEIYILWS
jgi:hypothetical protein